MGQEVGTVSSMFHVPSESISGSKIFQQPTETLKSESICEVVWDIWCEAS